MGEEILSDVSRMGVMARELGPCLSCKHSVDADSIDTDRYASLCTCYTYTFHSFLYF